MQNMTSLFLFWNFGRYLCHFGPPLSSIKYVGKVISLLLKSCWRGFKIKVLGLYFFIHRLCGTNAPHYNYVRYDRCGGLALMSILYIAQTRRVLVIYWVH